VIAFKSLSPIFSALRNAPKGEIAALGGRVRLALLLSVFALVGCGDIMSTYYKSVSTTAVLAGTCRDVLSEAHDQKTKAVIERAKTDKVGAELDLNAWMSIYEPVKTTCTSLKTAAKLALDAAPVVEAAVSKKKDAMGWIVRLGKLGFDAAATLASAGLKIGGK